MSFVKHEERFDVERYVRERDRKAKRYGYNVATTCPGCSKPKLWVLTKAKALSSGDVPAGSWICYYCGTFGRGAVSLVQQLEECDRASALQIVKSGSSREARSVDIREAVLSVFGDFAAAKEKADSFVEIDPPLETRPAWQGPRPIWFADKRISVQQCKIHSIGYCVKGKYKKRYIVPVFAPNGGPLVSFIARYMGDPPEGVKKVLYPPKVVEAPVLSRCLFNYDRAQSQRLIVITEDERSAMRVGKAAVGSFGTHFSAAQLDLLLQSRAEEIALMWDRDAMVRHKPRKCVGRCAHCARYEKTQRLIATLSEYWPVRAVVMPDHRDPKDRTRAACWRLIHAAASNNVVDALRAIVSSKL